MHKNYKLDEKVLTNIIYRHLKPLEHGKQVKLIIYSTRFTSFNLIVKNNTKSSKTFISQNNGVNRFTSPFREGLSKNNITANSYIGYTTTTPCRRLTYHFSDISAIKKA